ncbi:HIR complex subunit [Homalodisca vitripennis]|nr:HIR complex subunit [Homalodisca vitripennis]
MKGIRKGDYNLSGDSRIDDSTVLVGKELLDTTSSNDFLGQRRKINETDDRSKWHQVSLRKRRISQVEAIKQGMSAVNGHSIITDLATELIDSKVIDYGLSDHDSVCTNVWTTNLNIPCNKNNQTVSVVRPITPDKLCNFINHLLTINWEFVVDSVKDAETRFNDFFQVFINGFHFCFPEVILRARKNRPTRPKWFTPELKVMRERLIFYQDFAKSTGSLEAKKVYSIARKTYQYEIRQAKLKTNAAYIEGAANKCSAAWKVIRQEKLGTNITTVSVTPDKFNDYFLSVAEEALKNVQAAPFNPIDITRRSNAPVEDMR